MIPEKILDYKINRLIGEGGMAKVYEADLDSKLGTKVAIKVLDRHLASESSIRARFKQEAKSMLQLKHPYVVNVLNFVEEKDTLAIVMEYIEGQTLKDMVEQGGPISPKLAIQIFTEILEAMQYVHNKGVVHRDIKPSNIFIIEGKYPKILDFGIVKVLGGESLTKTKTGLTIGTPMYMSPEQVQTPQDIDYRTDIYSLGVTLHYMLAGNPPYDPTGSEFIIQSKVVQEPLPKLSGVPTNLINAISGATQKDRNDRFKSCEEFIQNFNKNLSVSDDVTVIEKVEEIIDDNSNKVENSDREQELNLFFITKQDYFPKELVHFMKEDLVSVNNNIYHAISSFEYKNPNTMFWAAFPGGIFGIDRFLLGETGLGILKLVFGVVTYGIWVIVDCFTIKKRTRKYNYERYLEIKTGILQS
jgi:serine/threonine protein kinase